MAGLADENGRTLEPFAPKKAGEVSGIPIYVSPLLPKNVVQMWSDGRCVEMRFQDKEGSDSTGLEGCTAEGT